MRGRPLRILGIGDAKSPHFIRWAMRMSSRGHEVHVVSNRFPPEETALDGLAAHDLFSLDPTLRVPGIRRLRVAPALAGLARRLDVDIVHAHYLLPYGWWAAQAGARPLVVSPWGKEILIDAQTGTGRRRARLALAAGDRFPVTSRATANATIAFGVEPERVKRILFHANIDGYGPERADPALRARFGWPDDAVVVLSLRYARPYTNVDVLIRAFAKVIREEPRARLLSTAGGGWTRGELDRLVDELELQPFVTFYSARADELPVITASADLVVTLADVDAAPASLLESMASGLPIVCGFAPSMDEWVAQGDGAEMVPTKDVDAVAAAILRLIRDPELRRRYGERNVRVVREQFGDPGAELESMYYELVPR